MRIYTMLECDRSGVDSNASIGNTKKKCTCKKDRVLTQPVSVWATPNEKVEMILEYEGRRT